MIYEPEEDTFLILETVLKNTKNKNLNVLEIGSGSGFILESLKENGFKKVKGVDINPEAVIFCKNKSLNVIESDLFSKIKEKFDIIIFNPPYLPLDKLEDSESKVITTGGKTGSETINRFLKEAKKHLLKNGKVFLLTSSLTKGIKWSGYKKKLISEKKLFFEKLFVWELNLLN
ncbi:MAG: methyltransferase [Nanoarchaeota archaeon]|nr:methyltransferase [Nanoarchaeota archaeon]